jgi:hypothetical protein
MSLHLTSLKTKISHLILPWKPSLTHMHFLYLSYDFGTIARPIQSLTLPHDGLDSDNLKFFSAGILKDMKAGSFDNAIFLRRNEGGSQEKMFITYSPVKVRSLSPVDSSDFSRGVRYVDKLVYSVAFVVPVEELTAPYDRITDIVSGATQKTGYTFFMLIAMTAVVVLIITSMIAITVTRPMMSLLKIVESINEKSIQEELPPMTGGSREVNQVYNSFAKLYKVVRFSNMAFFSGNMFLANKFLKDALKLFRNVDDKKAMRSLPIILVAHYSPFITRRLRLINAACWMANVSDVWFKSATMKRSILVPRNTNAP